MLFSGIEVAMIVLFMLVLADAIRQYSHDKKKILLLGLAFVYALIFENFNMLLSKGQAAGYFYNPTFSVYIWNTPLFIALAWAVLIYTAMHLSDMLNLKTFSKSFMDALLVIMIDLTLDIVAVRQNLWTWVGYSENMAWFGVPADNFIGWMLVTFMFSFMFRYLTRKESDVVAKGTRSEFIFLLPAFAYLAMLMLFSIINLAEAALGLTKSQEMFIFFAMIILFAAMLRKPEFPSTPLFESDNYTTFAILLTRLLFYSFIIWSIVLMEIFNESQFIIILLVGTIAAEILIYSSIWKPKKDRYELQHY
jgi:uncharacterized membrane protein